MKSFVLFAPALFVAAAHAQTLTIDNFTESQSVGRMSGSSFPDPSVLSLANGANRELKIGGFTSSMVNLSVSGGWVSASSSDRYTIEIDYTFGTPLNLLVGGVDRANTNLNLHFASNVSSSVDVNITFTDSSFASAYWSFGLLGPSSGLRSSSLNSISSTFNWSDVKSIDITYNANSDGNVTLGQDNLGFRAIAVSAVPEPSTYGLMLGGLALAFAALRRRRA